MDRAASRPGGALGLALAWVVTSGCAGAPPPVDDAAPPRRRPDGVSLDPPPALPVVADLARASEGVVALRAPLGSDAALVLLHAYVRAIATEDVAAMVALHTSDATFVLSPPGQAPRTYPGAAALWERRFARLDYGALAGAVVVREADATVRKIPPGTEASLPISPDAEGAPAAASGAELVVRAPIATARAAGQALLGTELVLHLRRDGDRWRVAAVVEDYALP